MNFRMFVKRNGFTLIELIVVMAILGLLSTVGLASFRSSQIKGRDAQRKNDLGQLQRGLEAYYNDKGHYPPDLPIAGSPWQDESVDGGALYMKEIPEDPIFGADAYDYDSSDGTYYKIYARLENTKDAAVPKVGGNPTTYPGTNCSGQECNYGVSSPNVSL